jgi:hypothetical protein
MTSGRRRVRCQERSRRDGEEDESMAQMSVLWDEFDEARRLLANGNVTQAFREDEDEGDADDDDDAAILMDEDEDDAEAKEDSNLCTHTHNEENIHPSSSQPSSQSSSHFESSQSTDLSGSDLKSDNFLTVALLADQSQSRDSSSQGSPCGQDQDRDESDMAMMLSDSDSEEGVEESETEGETEMEMEMDTESEIEREPETKKRDSFENLLIEYDEWAAKQEPERDPGPIGLFLMGDDDESQPSSHDSRDSGCTTSSGDLNNDEMEHMDMDTDTEEEVGRSSSQSDDDLMYMREAGRRLLGIPSSSDSSPVPLSGSDTRTRSGSKIGCKVPFKRGSNLAQLLEVWTGRLSASEVTELEDDWDEDEESKEGDGDGEEEGVSTLVEEY